MKKYFLITPLIFLFFKANPHENTVTLNDGYAFANIENSSIHATVWRINGEYEIARASNSSCKYGWISTADGGIGFRI